VVQGRGTAVIFQPLFRLVDRKYDRLLLEHDLAVANRQEADDDVAHPKTSLEIYREERIAHVAKLRQDAPLLVKWGAERAVAEIGERADRQQAEQNMRDRRIRE